LACLSLCKETFDAGVAGRLFHADALILGFFFGVIIMIRSIAAKLIGRFVRDQRGATMVEYGLLVALVAEEAKVALVAEPLMFIDWPLINVATVAADAERK
jgi:hypothetical protein